MLFRSHWQARAPLLALEVASEGLPIPAALAHPTQPQQSLAGINWLRLQKHYLLLYKCALIHQFQPKVPVAALAAKIGALLAAGAEGPARKYVYFS